MDVVVIDSSAIVAILVGENDRASLIERIGSSQIRLMSALNVYETCIIIEARMPAAGKVEELLQSLRVDIVPFDSVQAFMAARVYRIYGKGRHPAGLNMGDCAAYALAEYYRVPLLFKGDDFAATPLGSRQ